MDFDDGSNGMRLGVPLDNHIAVYRSLARGRKHLLLLNNADHMTFAVEFLPPGRVRLRGTRATLPELPLGSRQGRGARGVEGQVGRHQEVVGEARPIAGAGSGRTKSRRRSKSSGSKAIPVQK